jgi:sigma-B regulation protein RsbU (phosphoserine phosphatase)
VPGQVKLTTGAAHCIIVKGVSLAGFISLSSGEACMEDRYKFYYSIGRLFNSSLNIDLVLDIVLSRVIEEMNVQAGAFWIYDNERESAVCRSCQSPGGSSLKGATISLNSGVKGYCMRNRNSIIIEDVSAVDWFCRDYDKKLGTKTKNILCLPLLHKGRLLGVLDLINRKDPARPFTQEDIEMLEPLTSTAAMALDNIDLFTGVAEKERMKKELEFSSFLQSAILPRKTLVSQLFEMKVKMIPSRELGGDFYDWIELEEDKYLFLIGDVSGKGNPAAIFMAIVRSILWTVSNFFHDPRKICEKTNEFVRKSTRIDMFVTLLLLVVDIKKKTIKFVSCGHNSGILLRRNGEKIPLKTKGLPLGVNERSTYEQKELTLQEGDTMVLYTDGITEVVNEDGEEFGEKRFEKLILKHRQLDTQEILDKVFNRVDEFAAGGDVHDDRCMLILKFAEGTETLKASRSKLRSFSLNVSNEMGEVIKILEHIEKLALDTGFTREETNDILISVEETCVNVVRYALPSEKVNNFEVQSWFEEERLTVMVRDKGVPFDPTRFMESPADFLSKRRELGGYGLLLIKQLMDEVSYRYDEEKGNITTLIKKRRDGGGGSPLLPDMIKELIFKPN